MEVYENFLVIDARKRICEKVIFLHLSVRHSIHKWYASQHASGRRVCIQPCNGAGGVSACGSRGVSTSGFGGMYTPPLGKYPSGQTPLQADTALADTPWADTLPQGRHTPGPLKWAVRILLECILVFLVLAS